MVISAGPGWGKTTLLAQWSSQSERPFAWVHVDQNDNDPIVLLTYVAAALDRVSRLDPAVFDALSSPGVSVEGRVIPRLGAALATLEPELVLALDDLHLVENRACLDAVAALARHVPEGSQLALSTRGAPALPLGALRARGLELEIGPDDLRMDEAQAGQLLSAAGVDLPDAEIAELTNRDRGLVRGALSRGVLDQGARGQDPSRHHVLGRRPPRVRLPVVGAACPRVPGRPSLPDADGRARADVRPPLRRCSQGAAAPPRPWSRWRAPTCSWCHSTPDWRVVPLPPSLPGSAPVGAGANRAGSHARASRPCSRLVRGERSAGGCRSGTPKRLGTSTEWRAWSSVFPARLPKRPGRHRRALARLAGGSWGARKNAAVGVLGGLLAALWGRPVGGGALCRGGRERELRGHVARRQRLDRLVARPSSGPLHCRRGVASMARMRSSPSRHLPVEASSGRTPRGCSQWRIGWAARSSRPTNSLPMSPMRAWSWRLPTR